MLRPDHSLRFRSPSAASCAPVAVLFPPLTPSSIPRPRLGHRCALRPPRARHTLLTARASAGPGAAVERAPEMAQREVVRALAAEAEERLGPRLLPSAVPADVAQFRNAAGNAVGSLDVRRGAPGSSIDLMMQSSLHCKLPNGLIDITSILIYLNTSTDAPHFVMELIQGSPTSTVVLLDLLPRKDLALHPDYLQKYYEDTQLDKLRAKIDELPQARPYVSPSLFVRTAFSPTAILRKIDCGQGGETAMEEILRGPLALVAKEVLQTWFDTCADSSTLMEETEIELLVERDNIVRSKSIEVDLTANLPRMFDPDMASRVIAEIRKAFGVY